jgi:2,3-bisphosphoglycerate-independent phosphoglycerate mutase
VGEQISEHWPHGTGSELLIELTQRSTDILTAHPINQARVQNGKSPANMIWLWGQGRRPSLPTYRDKFHLSGGVISAVDLIKGLGKLLGLQVVNVPGATGYYDTNYKGKAAAAKDVLQGTDFVFVHVEAPDEAGHNGDLDEKIKAIERFDAHIVGEILHTLQGYNDFRLLVLPDHPTPLSVRTHTREPVPFALAGKGISSSGFSSFTEKEAHGSHIIFANGYKLAEAFLNPAHTF